VIPALAVAVLIGGFSIAGAFVLPAARRDLRLLHPAVVWLAVEAVFFGVGSAAMAVIDKIPGPALYVGGAAAATGAGVWLANRLSIRREPRTALPPPAARLCVERGVRRLGPPGFALISLAATLPTLVASGLPLLAGDMTAARLDLTGLPVQLIRIGLPGLAATWLLNSAAGYPPVGTRLVAWLALALTVGFGLLLASRYLPLELIAIVFLAWLLAGRRVALRPAIAVAVGAAVLFVAILLVRNVERTDIRPLEFAAERTVSRVFLVQPRTLAALQQRIPAEQPYFLGLTWLRRMGPLIGRPDIPNLGYWIFPDVVAGSTDQGYAAPGLVGEAWANFGGAGLVLFVLLGIACERLGVVVAARRERVVDVVAGAMAIAFVARTHALGVLGLAVLLALVLVWRWVAGQDAGFLRTLAAAATWRLRRPAAEAR
jgi:hypothetical protein